MFLCRPEVCAGVPDALPPAGPGDLAVAPGLWAPWSRTGLRCGPGDRGSEEEVEAKPEEEEGVQLRGETAAATEQLRRGFLFVPDHPVATTPPCVQFYKTLQTQAKTFLHIRCIFPQICSRKNLEARRKNVLPSQGLKIHFAFDV